MSQDLWEIPNGGGDDGGTPEDFAVRLGQDEIGLIFNLRENLDYADILLEQIGRYQEWGWRPCAVGPEGQPEVGIDFCQAPDSLSERLAELGFEVLRLSLALPTGSASRLLVLEIQGAEPARYLDGFGPWRSPCSARTAAGWEQHYYLLPAGSPAPLTGGLLEPGVWVYGEGGLVVAPPSVESETLESWRWQKAPWEAAPILPGPAVWRFLAKHPENFGLVGSQPGDQVPGWEEIYERLQPHSELMKAILAPAATPEAYYDRLAAAALAAGFTESAWLLGLLWHAPLGDAQKRPGRFEYLQELVNQACREFEPEAGSWPEEDSGLEETGGAAAAKPSPPAGVNWLDGPGPEGSSSGSAGGAAEGSFSQLGDVFKFLEKRVIVDRSSYESMLLQLKEASTRAASLERQISAYERRLKSRRTDDLPMVGESVDTSSQLQAAFGAGTTQPLAGVQSTLQEFLKENPDLSDPTKVQMLQFCLKNYIDINPEHNGLPFRAKLEKAAKMAREFLGERPKSATTAE